MTGADCFRCGAPAAESFGDGYLCSDCIPGGDVTGTPESGSVPEQTPSAPEQTPAPEQDTVRPSASVPAPLDELGELFVPIPPGEKAAERPRTPEHLFAPDDPVLEAYLEAGHNYGIACGGDLAVLDADEPDALTDPIDALPTTAWQVSGSRSSEHYFLQVPGLDNDIPLDDPDTGDNIGHIKAATQSYVVGPGSRHPSGNQYGPLRGDTIATIDENDLRELLEPYHAAPAAPTSAPSTAGPGRSASRGDSPIDIADVLTGYTEGARTEHPFHGSSTGSNFMVDAGGDTWRCWRHDCTGNALHLVGIEQGVISCGDWATGGLSTETWSEIFDAARDAGYDLPDHGHGGEGAGESIAVLPNTPKHRALSRGWDWTADTRHDDGLTIDAARDRTTDAIADAISPGGDDQVLVEALPTMGKSYGAVKAAARTGQPVTILTGRGREEQYDQLKQWCDEHGLTYKQLPSFTHDCETANGSHGEDWRDTVMDWYRRGATPQAIHKYADDHVGQPLPCQAHDGQECGLTSKWRFDPDDHPSSGEPWDVLIGHYAHAHKRKVTQGRAVIFDEFPDNAYENAFGPTLQGAVTTFLQTHDDLPYDDFTDLIEHRDDQARLADALAWFDDDRLDPDPDQVFRSKVGRADASIAAFTLLAAPGNALENGWERALIDDRRIGLHDREDGDVWLMQPPDLTYASAVVALDGTPTPRMWELATGERLTHRPVLTDSERTEYIRDALGLQLVRTTDWIKPYNNADFVDVDGDAALLEKIHDTHGSRPSVITTATALDEYNTDEHDVHAHIDETAYYGNVLGSNQFADTRLGAVIGSNHYGDQFIERWSAYANHAAERNDQKGAALSYGPFGDDVLTHMREHDTLQAAMRFGRDGNGAVVYVHTDTLPDWVPIAAEGRILKTWSDGTRQVVRALEDLRTARAADIAAHDAVEIGERQVLNVLADLADRGHVDRERDPDDGRRYVWRDDGLHRLSEHGDVDLEPVAIDELDAEEVNEISRMDHYTWEFVQTAVATTDGAGVGRVAADGGSRPPPKGGDRPPDDSF